MPGVNIRPVAQPANPFPTHGIKRDANGIARYTNLPRSLLDLLDQRVRATPDVEAVVELDGQRLSYRELWERAARVAGGLRACGLENGDHVALRHPAGMDWVLGFWGTIMAGGIPVLLNTRFTESEVAYVLADAGVRSQLLPNSPLPDGEPFVIDSLASDDIAALFYTSGTTSNPKGVPTTHRALLTNAENMVRTLGLPPEIGAGLRTLICVPLYHVTGCNSQLLVAAHVGGTAIIMPVLALDRLIAVLASERISFLVAVPAIYALLLNNPRLGEVDIPALRWVGYGGAPIAASLVQSIQAAFPAAEVFNGFGMTETASLISVLPHRDAADYADSVGYPAPVVDVAIDAAERETAGELLVRGPNVINAYWKQAAPASFVDGWLRTGDVFETDAAGRLYLVDRAKDLINRGGENISSIEVEAALADAPNVAEAAALPVPDAVMGEKVGVVLVAQSGELDLQAVLDHARTRLAAFKLPEYASIQTTPLPRNGAGKLLKASLRDTIHWGAPLR